MSRWKPACVRTGVSPAATSRNRTRVDDVPAVESEDLGRDREVEDERALVDHGRDGVHVRKLAKVVRGTSLARPDLARCAASSPCSPASRSPSRRRSARLPRSCRARPRTRPAAPPATTGRPRRSRSTAQTAWVACKEQSRLVRIDPQTRQRRRHGRARRPADRRARRLRLRLGARLGRHALPHRPADRPRRRAASRPGAITPYNLWAGAGSLWVVDDATGEVVRIAPASGRVLKLIKVGDGAADMVFAGPSAWVVNHRDLGLVRIDTRDEPADAARDPEGRRARADGPARGQPLDHGPRHRPAQGEPADRRGARDLRHRGERHRRRRRRRRALGAEPERGGRPDRFPDDGGAAPRLAERHGHDGRRRRAAASTCTASRPTARASGSPTTRAARCTACPLR